MQKSLGLKAAAVPSQFYNEQALNFNVRYSCWLHVSSQESYSPIFKKVLIPTLSFSHSQFQTRKTAKPTPFHLKAFNYPQKKTFFALMFIQYSAHIQHYHDDADDDPTLEQTAKKKANGHGISFLSAAVVFLLSFQVTWQRHRIFRGSKKLFKEK